LKYIDYFNAVSNHG